MTEVQTCAICGCTDASACVDELLGACLWVAPKLCSHCAQPDRRRAAALIAACQLSEVVAELLRFSREGDQEIFTPFALDPAENTADALRAILGIERVASIDPNADPNSDANQMCRAIDCFLDGWA